MEVENTKSFGRSKTRISPLIKIKIKIKIKKIKIKKIKIKQYLEIKADFASKKIMDILNLLEIGVNVKEYGQISTIVKLLKDFQKLNINCDFVNGPLDLNIFKRLGGVFQQLNIYFPTVISSFSNLLKLRNNFINLAEVKISQGSEKSASNGTFSWTAGPTGVGSLGFSCFSFPTSWFSSSPSSTTGLSSWMAEKKANLVSPMFSVMYLAQACLLITRIRRKIVLTFRLLSILLWLTFG